MSHLASEDTKTTNPAPPSHHDIIVNKLLERPAPIRTVSLPSPNHSSAQLVRSASDTAEDSRPVIKLLDGPLEPSGGRVTRALTAQIEAVLNAQEEIARAHLALEDVGALQPPPPPPPIEPIPEEGEEVDKEKEKAKEKKAAAAAAAAKKQFEELEKRSASVDEIMHKVRGASGAESNARHQLDFTNSATNTQLSVLSSSLKSYHAIGTPMISFPRRPHNPAQPASPCTPQILVANAATARGDPTRQTTMPSAVEAILASPRSMAQSPAAMSRAISLDRSASVSVPATAGASSANTSVNTISSNVLQNQTQTREQKQNQARDQNNSSKLSINTSALRPRVNKDKMNVWIHRQGLLGESGITDSPTELTPARPGARKTWEREREREKDKAETESEREREMERDR
jgi:hypothetical protein